MTVVIDLSGSQGNAYYLMGLVRNLASQLDLDEVETNDILNKMMSSDYDNLLNVFIDNFGVVVDIYKNGKRYVPKATKMLEQKRKRKLIIRSLEPIFEVNTNLNKEIKNGGLTD